MIVQRLTVHYKLGKVQEAISLLSEEFKRAQFPHAVRLCIPKIGISDMTIGEFEFENIDQMEQFWGNWEAQPEVHAFLQKYDQLREPGMVSEILDLA